MSNRKRPKTSINLSPGSKGLGINFKFRLPIGGGVELNLSHNFNVKVPHIELPKMTKDASRAKLIYSKQLGVSVFFESDTKEDYKNLLTEFNEYFGAQDAAIASLWSRQRLGGFPFVEELWGSGSAFQFFMFNQDAPHFAMRKARLTKLAYETYDVTALDVVNLTISKWNPPAPFKEAVAPDWIDL
jgi:hypothetical protein